MKCQQEKRRHFDYCDYKIQMSTIIGIYNLNYAQVITYYNMLTFKLNLLIIHNKVVFQQINELLLIEKF